MASFLGSIVPLLELSVLVSLIPFSNLADTERTLIDFRRECSTFDCPDTVLYLSRLPCVEFVLVGLGDGIPVTDNGRGFTLASCVTGTFTMAVAAVTIGDLIGGRCATDLGLSCCRGGATTVASLEIELLIDRDDFVLVIP